MTHDIRAVLFDYGHTLVDFTVPQNALHEVYGTIRERLVEEAEIAIPAPTELVERIARRITSAVDLSYQNNRLVELDILQLLEDALSSLGFTPSAELVRWVAEVEHKALSAHLRVSTDTLNALQVIHDAGIRIGIVSNAHLLPDLMRQDWAALGLADYVDASVISCELGVRKPAPEIFLTALRRLDIEPQAAVFVGDRSLDDVRGAHAVGMRAILTTEFRHSPGRVGSSDEDEAFTSEQPELTVNRLADIVPFVLNQGSLHVQNEHSQ